VLRKTVSKVSKIREHGWIEYYLFGEMIE